MTCPTVRIVARAAVSSNVPCAACPIAGMWSYGKANRWNPGLSWPTPMILAASAARNCAACALNCSCASALTREPRPSRSSAHVRVKAAPSFARNLPWRSRSWPEKTLLVDANLRKPRLDKLFRGARSDAGLTEVLLGKTRTLPLHRVTGPQHLALLTAGTPPTNPVDLLSGTQFERLVRDWSRSYDYVLIDTPPTSLRSDGIVIAHAVRNVVLVAHRNKTSYAEVTELQRRLDSTQTRILGAVLNDF